MLIDRKPCFVDRINRKKRATWNCVLFLLAFCFVSNESSAQVYPVQATVQLTPPYSLYLADYVESGSERLALNIFLSDIARPDLDVRFRLKIIGQGITLETKPGYIPPPVSIQGGVSLRLISTDLAEYFNPNNLTFQGLSQREYAQRGKLPEGVYQFCFEVLEYNRGLKISNTACAVAWLVLNDPPIVNLPRQEEKLKAQSLQNVMFQWTPRHTGSPNSAFTTEYEIKMVEVWPATRNPNDAVLTSPPILEETTRNTTFIYGPGETPLEPGRRYAFRVQAKSISGVDELDLFKNHGYSEVVSFVYGDACDLPTGISIESVGPSRFALRWESMFNHTAFKVRYRQEGTVDWYENNVSLESTQILSLKPSTTYEYQVAATCGFFDGDYSPIARVTTAEEVPADYSCGIPLTPFNLDPSELTGSLKPGDIIDAGDFQVQLISVSGSNGIFSGEGIIEVPYLNKAKVKTSFTNITVSKELRMVNGFMNVTGAAVDVVPQEIMDGMEQLSEVLEAVDTALNIIEENIPEQIDWNSFVADTLVAVSGEIIGVNKNEDGSVTVTDSNGQTQTLPAGNNYAVKDEAGNGYLVDKNGNIHATTSDVATKLANREYNLLVTFRKDAISNYGFDQSGLNPPDDTEVLPKGDEKKGYNVAWKSVASGRVDGVIAGLEGSGIDKSKIRFELGGIDVQAPPLGPDQTARVVVTGKSDASFEELLALYTPSDTSKVQVLGKLKVASYDELRRKLVIVPVNNSILPKEMTAQSIQDSLNAIYHQAVVHWEVEVKPAISVALSDQFDDGGSGLLSNYTGDMKKVINAYGTLEEDTYYLFLVRNPSSGLGLGYMPRGKEAGFIFVDKHRSNEALVRTMAHEVGHGAFNLAHTFDEVSFPITKGTSDNLMDYPAGNKLYKYQWDKVRYPDIVVGLFEEDEAGAMIATAVAVEPSDEWEDLDLGAEVAYVYCFTPAGKIFALPATAKLNFVNNTNVAVPQGAMVSYELNDQQYFANYEKTNGKWYFIGYLTKGGNRGYSYITTEQLEAQLSNGNIDITTAALGATLLIPLEEQILQQWMGTLGTEAAKNLKNVGRVTIVTIAASVVLELFVSTSSLEYGVGELVTDLPLPAIAISRDRNYEQSPPTTIPIAIPHAISQNKGYCHVYVIWGLAVSGPFVAKYGMTCQEDYTNENECNPRPDLQCNKFRRENTDPTILDYRYSWVIRNVHKDIAYIVERSMTAAYVIVNQGRLPPNHYLPCFVKQDDFDERIDRATDWLDRQINEYGK